MELHIKKQEREYLHCHSMENCASARLSIQLIELKNRTISDNLRECVIYVLEHKFSCTKMDSEKDRIEKHMSNRIATRMSGRDIVYNFLN